MQRENNVGGVTGCGFVKGKSGNPRGRPRGTISLNAILRRTMTRENANVICKKLIAMAEGGDLAAIKILFDRLDTDIETRLDALEKQMLTKNTP